MVELEEKTNDIEELKIPEIKENESQEEQQIIIPKKKSKKWIIISSFMMIVILLIFSTIFALINIGNKRIIKGISIENIDVSNMTIEEATNLL